MVVVELKFCCTDNGSEGSLATMHVIVTQLASLHKKCLVMEDTARGRLNLRIVFPYSDFCFRIDCITHLQHLCLSYFQLLETDCLIWSHAMVTGSWKNCVL